MYSEKFKIPAKPSRHFRAWAGTAQNSVHIVHPRHIASRAALLNGANDTKSGFTGTL
jgi:hypothetical protein